MLPLVYPSSPTIGLYIMYITYCYLYPLLSHNKGIGVGVHIGVLHSLHCTLAIGLLGGPPPFCQPTITLIATNPSHNKRDVT